MQRAPQCADAADGSFRAKVAFRPLTMSYIRANDAAGNGMAQAVFKNGERLADLPGFMGVGHLRYPTAGSSANAEAQPFFVNAPGIAFSHNGNLINAPELKRFLDEEAHRHINTDSDSELMLNIFANELYKTGKARINSDDCFAALKGTYAKCQGSWACTAMLAGFGLIAFRDPYGIRPLCLGSRKAEGQGRDYMLASESVALNFFGSRAEDIVDIKPGEAVVIEKGKGPVFHQIQEPLAYAPDIFEFFYFARPESILDGINVYASRRNMGFSLAKTIAEQLGPERLAEVDAVIPIPETSNVSARCVATSLGKDLIEGFVKNRYIFRTFIMPTQKLRRTGVRRKLNAIASEFKGKNVLLIDDSIVRGTTSKEIVLLAREAGAKKVFFASCAPPITHVHIYGIDLASSTELIASHKSPLEIAHEIGADAMIYQTLPDLEAACAKLSPRPNQRFEVGVFCGNYITPVQEDYFEHLEAVRKGRKELKAQEQMKRAFLNGGASADEVKEVEENASKRRRRGENVNVATKGGSNSQDINLHNFNDHER